MAAEHIYEREEGLIAGQALRHDESHSGSITAEPVGTRSAYIQTLIQHQENDNFELTASE